MTIETSNQSPEPTPSLVEQTWWHKPLIWGTFLVLLYVLHEFFLIGFLTFLFCFVIRSAVGFLEKRISPRRNLMQDEQRIGRNNHRLDLALTLVVFLGLSLTLYGLGRYFVPKLIRQGRSLVTRMQNSNAEQVQNTLLANTVGSWRFDSRFGKPDDPRYQKGLSEFQAAGRNGEGLYQEFPKLHSSLEADFEANYEQARVLHLRSQDAQGTSAEGPLRQWFLDVKAPQLFDNRQDYYIQRWEAEHESPEHADELAALRQQPDFQSRRDEQIRTRIWTNIKSDPVLLADLKNQWAHAVSIQKWEEFRASPEYQAEFKEFYAKQREQSPSAAPIDYAYYQTLAAAYPKGKPAFLAAVRQHDETQNVSPAHQQFDFESATKLELGQQWWATSHTADWFRDHAANDGPKLLEAMVKRVDEGIGGLVKIPIQVITALMLAVFILIEWHGMKSSVADLRNTRLRPIFDEIAPGMVALGKLIGKSFQGQVLISMFNACFTLTAMWIIGVEYKFILALLVFVFSFIPVLGVLLSGVPICAIAVLQPGGSIWMAIQVIIAIAIVHLTESMILSPRIIGKIGHLHPVLVIAILLVAEHFFGMWGLVLGVPVAIYIIRVVILRSPIPGIYQPPGQESAALAEE